VQNSVRLFTNKFKKNLAKEKEEEKEPVTKGPIEV